MVVNDKNIEKVLAGAPVSPLSPSLPPVPLTSHPEAGDESDSRPHNFGADPFEVSDADTMMKYLSSVQK